MNLEESLFKSLSLDYLNLLINGQAFSDVTFSVDGHLIHAHRCILAARSLFFRKFFCSSDPPSGFEAIGSRNSLVIPVNSIGYEAFFLLLQFLYSGQVSIVPQKQELRPNCGERGCWHTHCRSAVDLALDVLAAARSFGVEQLALLTQKQLESMVEEASIEDVTRVLMASRKQDMHQLWTTCSHLIAKSGLPPETLSKHLPIEVVKKIEELRLKSSLAARGPLMHPQDLGPAEVEDLKIRRMRGALDSSDVELVKLMVMGEGLNLDKALAVHYAVKNCSREVVKALLELGVANVNHPAGRLGKTPLHLAAEMVSPDMVAVLLDHHADPTARSMEGATPLDVLRSLTSDFLFKGAVPGLTHIEPNKLRLCLELVQSAAFVLSREEAAADGNVDSPFYAPAMTGDSSNTIGNMVGLSLDSTFVYLNLGATAAASAQLGCKMDGGNSNDNSSDSQREAMNRHGFQRGCDPSLFPHEL